jgi:hypothetical protein
MKKLILLLLILIGAMCAKSQIRTFKVGDFVEVFPGDSLKEYFSGNHITTAECANFYRVGRIDSTGGNIVGPFHDNYMNGKTMFTATYENGMLTGLAKFYYSNGRVKEAGKYIRDKRAGIWKYYYDNGNLCTILHFMGDSTFVVQTYSRGGTIKVANGNGFYKNMYSPSIQYEISGKLVNGKPDGEWKINNGEYGTEQFKNGVLIKGVDDKGKMYTNKSMVGFSDYCVNENLANYEYRPACPGWVYTYTGYASKMTLLDVFYPSLVSYIKKYSSPANQWLMVGITFDKDIKPTATVYSSTGDTALEQYVTAYINSLTLWHPATVKGGRGYQPIFFTVILNKNYGDESVMVPAEYVLRQSLKKSFLFHNTK